jgi:hypothetical protein
LYVTVGPEWKIRRGKRFAPFAEALVGIVSTRSTPATQRALSLPLHAANACVIY